MLEQKQPAKQLGIILSGLVENLVTHILTRKICAFLADDTAISSIEYCLLLAFIGGALMVLRTPTAVRAAGPVAPAALGRGMGKGMALQSVDAVKEAI